MSRDVLVLLIAWLPLWIAGLRISRPRRFGAILLGAALAGFVGGMCCVELRRHGVLVAPMDAVSIPPLGLKLHEVLRFAALGAGGALGADILLNRLGVTPASPRGEPGDPGTSETGGSR